MIQANLCTRASDGAIRGRWHLLRTVIKNLGIKGAIRYVIQERALRLYVLVSGKRSRSHIYWLSTPLSHYPLACRFGSSDREVFVQVFIRKSYVWAETLKNVRTIVDLGANVGYASAYFLSLFKEAHLVAIEPDPGNFAILQRNLRPFGSRVTCIHAAVWSHNTYLKIIRGRYRDGKEWATQVRECTEDEDPDVSGLDIHTLMAATGLETIDLLKVDIEGAESRMFSNTGSWIHSVGTIMIELHDLQAEAIFLEAVAKAGRFVLTTDRELTIATSLVQPQNEGGSGP